MPEDLRKFAKRASAAMRGEADPEQEELIRRYQEEADKQFAAEDKARAEDQAMRDAGVDPDEERRKEAMYAAQKRADEVKAAKSAEEDVAVRKYLASHDEKVREEYLSKPTIVRMLADAMSPAKSASVESTQEARARAEKLAAREATMERAVKAANGFANPKLERIVEAVPGSPVARAIEKLTRKRREPTGFERYFEEK